MKEKIIFYSYHNTGIPGPHMNELLNLPGPHPDKNLRFWIVHGHSDRRKHHLVVAMWSSVQSAMQAIRVLVPLRFEITHGKINGDTYGGQDRSWGFLVLLRFSHIRHRHHSVTMSTFHYDSITFPEFRGGSWPRDEFGCLLETWVSGET